MTLISLFVTAGLIHVASATPAIDGAFSAPPALERQATAPASRWQPWLGCWQMLEESVEDGSAPIARMLGVPPPTSSTNTGTRVCVTAGSGAAVTLTTTVNGRSVLTETIVADGSQQPLTEPDCRGWQRNEWSTLGARLFATAEIACTAQTPRKVSGMAMMMAGPTWIDIQMIESEGRKSLRVRRYRPVAEREAAREPSSPLRTATQIPLGLKLSIADVKEAAARVAPEVVQAALVELKSGFDLNSNELIALDKAGVSRSTIDLMVALSFPQRFVVESTSGGGGGFSSWSYGAFDQMWPFFAHPYWYTSYYAPFGYRYWGYYDPYYFNGPGFVIVDPGPGQPGAIEPSGEGRVVDGRGYTRVRRNAPEPAPGRVNGNDGGSSTTSAGGSNPGSSSSGSGSVSSGGYSSGGGGGGDRTAQPRPPGR